MFLQADSVLSHCSCTITWSRIITNYYELLLSTLPLNVAALSSSWRQKLCCHNLYLL